MHPAIQLLLAVTVATAAFWDLRVRRIPNWLTFPAIVAGLAANAWLAGYRGVLWSGAGLLLAGGFYLLLYWLRAMGAGDVKLMAAAGAAIGPQMWLLLFFWTATCGGVLAIVTIVRKGLGRRALRNMGRIVGQLARLRAPHRVDSELDVRSSSAATAPHGVAIAIGALILLATS